jgi:hypothetical protein
VDRRDCTQCNRDDGFQNCLRDERCSFGAPAPPAIAACAPTIEAAHAMGASGSPAVEAERLAFEAWMRGHCWALSAVWTGTQYVGTAEHSGHVCPHAMGTRRIWAAWRDRGALAAAAAKV